METKNPNTLFISCCDDRIFPYRITSKERGELFILRNIGNLIPPHGAADVSVAAAIEYAIGHLEIPEIIVCGHSDCGAMKAALGKVENGSSLEKWLEYAVPYDSVTSPDELSKNNVSYNAPAKRVA